MKAGEPKGPIQLIASGLLGFFQLKDQGNPTVINDDVQPSLDLRDWYFISEMEAAGAAATAAINPGVVGYQNFTTPPAGITVPQNEIWYVTNFTISVALPLATDDAIVRPAMLWRPGTANVGILPHTPLHSRAAAANSAAGVSAANFWAPPGAQLGMYWERSTTATQLAASGFLMFTRMRR